MSIRRRLAVCFTAIALLFPLNLGVYFWSNGERDASLRQLSQSLGRQLLIASIRQGLNDLQKEMALLGQVYGESVAGQPAPEETARLQARLDAVRRDIAEARRLSPGEPLGDFPNFFEELAISWKTVHESLGFDNARAIKELSIRAEPLAQTVIGGLLREWEAREKSRVEMARSNLEEVETLVRRTTVSIFLVSTLLALSLVYGAWRSVVPTSEELERRVEERTMELAHEIEERQRAEEALRESEARSRSAGD